ncbi:hypothetical protein IAI58_19200 (plasmid) [Roseomonas marmotae]|uniref:hypothetical protein n=1 Tax=Roseomonas marmotae TaxID=2768161 RepID=UPI001AD7A544|nr:hypothetical protein [Roseomonas marmotae]QTI81471.1 hypothetical protein IAI58_19200 [Roseomonas marmotae]
MDQQFVARIMDQAKKNISDEILKVGLSNAIGDIERRSYLRKYADALLLREFTQLAADQIMQIAERKLRAKEAFDALVQDEAETLIIDDFRETVK